MATLKTTDSIQEYPRQIRNRKLLEGLQQGGSEEIDRQEKGLADGKK